MIYKEQETDFDYTMHFLCMVPLLEHVEIFKNDLLIYEAVFNLSDDESYSYLVSESFYEIVTVEDGEETRDISQLLYTNTYDIVDDLRVIDYSYDSTSENIIPLDDYRISAITFDEYLYEKGFPENDDILNNIYDHDISLDELGALHNIPRKKYIPATNYLQTEPPYNDRLTEDDYHYMKRIIEYLALVHTEPLPVAEIYKLYGLPAKLINRDRFIVRMFDITKHPHHIDETTGEYIVDDWIPEPWEHKDTFCIGGIDLGEYFYVSADRLNPIRKQNVTFTFDFVNCLLEPLTGDFTVDINLNGTDIYTGYTDSTFICPYSLLEIDNTFIFTGKHGTHILGVFEIHIHVRGCSEADFFVTSSGNDTKDGKTLANAFKTIEKGTSVINGIYELISVYGRLDTVGDSIVIDNTTVLGCNSASLDNEIKPIFFNVLLNNMLTLQDLTFNLLDGSIDDENSTTFVDTDTFTNEPYNDKEMDNPLTVLMYNVNYGVLITDLSNTTFIKNIKFNTTTGVLSWDELTLEEILKLKDLTGVIADMELIIDDDVYYNEYVPVTTDEKLLNLPFVYLEDRKPLVEAIETMTYDISTGVLTLDLCGDDIIWQPKSHSI
ncbi:hypothetical protein [uncultured Methanobrevibacter sp.]|uniref:hypothetical protein n=1 Tax=uncultured Methanobrevibacter sp. TaxID=253161 RepID=UPI0025CC60D7|nr:hypothetical protein [uncultured Methanobrevibacter sp.]